MSYLTVLTKYPINIIKPVVSLIIFVICNMPKIYMYSGNNEVRKLSVYLQVI